MRRLRPGSEADMVALFLRTELPAARSRDSFRALLGRPDQLTTNQATFTDLTGALLRWIVISPVTWSGSAALTHRQATGVCSSASTRAETDKPPGTLTVAACCPVIVTSPERLNSAGPLTASAVPPPLAWASTPVPPEAVRPCTAVPPPRDSPFTPGPDPGLPTVTAGLPLIPEVEVAPATPTRRPRYRPTPPTAANATVS